MQLADPEKFAQQVDWADVVYLTGGFTDVLNSALKKDTRWLQYLEGKTIGGTSAGADVLGKYFYNLDTLVLGDGLGLLPIKVIPHWCSDYNAPNIDWDKAETELKAYKEDLPLVTLREGEFKVFTQ